MRAANGVATVLAVLITLTGCTKRVYLPVERYVMSLDSLKSVEVRYDSVMMRDSVFVWQRGDTVSREVWRWHYRERMVRDTLWRERRDTVTISRSVPCDKSDAVQARGRGVNNVLARVAIISVIVSLVIVSAVVYRRRISRF